MDAGCWACRDGRLGRWSQGGSMWRKMKSEESQRICGDLWKKKKKTCKVGDKIYLNT